MQHPELWGMVHSIPYNIITVWALFRMVPMRRPKLFFLLWQLVSFPIFLIPTESSYGWLRPLVTSTLWMGGVLLFARQRSLRAAFAAMLISLISVVGEVVTAMISMLLFQKFLNADLVLNDQKTMVLLQFIFYGVVALLCWLLVLIWQRSVHPQEEANLWRFAPVPVGQYFLVVFCAIFSLMQRASLENYLLLGMMALCCILADILLFRALRQYTAQQLALQRTALLEEQLQQQLEYYHGVVARIEQTACLRHDLRNQLQTIYTLMERGEYDRAEELLTAFAAPLKAQEGAPHE